MAITFKSFLECVPFVTAIKKPVLLRSRHGVGKSSVVYQIAESLGLPVVERRASQMTEGDLLGLPKLSNGRTEWLPPNWFQEACEKPVVLFIDELDRATLEVRQGFFELSDSRKIAGHSLHPDTLIFAAINGGEHGAQYSVGEMDPAELDRWTVFDLEPSVEDWLDWGKANNIHSVVWDFINNNPNHLEHTKDFEPNKVYPSRRSWHRFSDCLVKSKLLESNSVTSAVYNLCTAFLGLEASVSFGDYVKNYSFQLTPEDILDKGLWEKTKEYKINDHLALVERLKGEWEKIKLTKAQASNLAKYFDILPSEIAMKLWSDIGESSAKENGNFHNVRIFSTFVKAKLTSIVEVTISDKKEEK